MFARIFMMSVIWPPWLKMLLLVLFTGLALFFIALGFNLLMEAIV